MNHPETINYPGGLAQLAEDLGNLRYDALSLFFDLLSKKLAKDSEADKERERSQLSSVLFAASENMANAWKISRRFMTNSN
jgi:hypothetical protein